MTRRRVMFQIKPPPAGANPIEWVHEAIEEIITRVKDGINPNDKVGLTFKMMNHYTEGWVPFQEASKLNADSLWDIVGSIVQSNEDIMIDDTFEIVVTICASPDTNECVSQAHLTQGP